MRLLISFAMLQQYKEMWAVLDTAISSGYELMIDSGAFSNFRSGKEIVTLEGYKDFLIRYGASFKHYINFDVVGDGAKSRENYEYLRSEGLNPIPVLTLGSSISEALHFNSYDYYCLGGMAKSSKEAKFEMLDIYQRAGLDLSKSHLLGVSIPSVIYKYKPRSFDSSYYMSQSFNGQGLLYNPIALQYEHYNDFSKDNYQHYFVLYGCDDRVAVNAAEVIQYFRHCEAFGSLGYYVVCRRKDFETLMKGRELYEKRRAA